MRALVLAALAGALAAGAAYAHNAMLPVPQAQAAGVLTCTTKPELSLVFGTVPVADCTFQAYRGGFRQHYVALLHQGREPMMSDVAQTLTWRVSNADGFARPGMLDGVFLRAVERPGLAAPDGLTGPRASLTLLTQTAAAGTRFAADYPRVVLAATATGLAR